MFTLNSGRTVNLLIVEDSEDHIILIKQELKNQLNNQNINVNVSEASSGLEADNMINQDPFEYDIILLDYSLPEKSGLELLNRIREISKRVQVIITTGMGSEKIAGESLRLGANDYIIKEENFALNVAKAVINAFEKLTLQDALQQKEEQLRFSELKYRKLINQANDGIVIIDNEEKITEVNEKLLKLTGSNQDELIGSHCLELFVTSDKERVSRHYQSGKMIDAEIKSRDNDSVPVEISVKAVDIEEEEGKSFAIMILRDDTENKRLEKILKDQTERLESKILSEKGI
ncbi:MAG: response regulator [Candidatus Hodarchaeales archaeon]|jgi:PAS domain S-box-containing protein